MAAQKEADIVSGAHKTYTHTVEEGVNRYIRDVTNKKATKRWEMFRLSACVRDFPNLAQKILANVRTSDLADWRDARLKKVTATTVLRKITP